ncbi:MAG: ABC transporter ATP-binding protein [Dehalococcoidia bacterium]
MIRIRGLSASFDSFRLKDIDLDVAEGEHFVLLGPSGAGKTLLTETILGLRRHSEGEILLGGQPVCGGPANGVSVSYVPQDLAIFPHMCIRDNIAFGARVRRMDPPSIDRKLGELAALLGITDLLDRWSTDTLSMGEKQRVALARALIVEPRILFLDEPFSSLDFYIRRQLIEKLREIKSTLSVTIFQVTHDHEEAFMLGDRIAVMFEGKIVQVGPPWQLQRRPASLEVARFLLARNIFQGEVEEIDQRAGKMRARVDALCLVSPAVDQLSPGQKVSVVIRPEEVHIIRPDRPLGPKVRENLFDGRIEKRIPTPGGYVLIARIEGLKTPVEIHLSNCAFDDLGLDRRSRVQVSLKSEALWFIPR